MGSGVETIEFQDKNNNQYKIIYKSNNKILY